jgi:hypothetical protein
MTVITNLYSRLFGKEKIQDGNVIDMAEHGRVGGVSTGQGFKYVTVIDGTIPTEGNNPSITLSYDIDGNLQYIDETIGAKTYRTTLTYTGGVLTGVSEVVEL